MNKISQTTRFWYNGAGNGVKKQVINHTAIASEGVDTSSVSYYVRDANEAVMAIYQQTVLHASGAVDCLRKPSNTNGWDNDMDGQVEGMGSCDNCQNGAPPMGGSSWNPWQEDYDRDGVGDACDLCPFQPGPENSPCVGEPAIRKMELAQWE